MKRYESNLLIILAIIVAFSNTGICNDPDPDTPWPVAFALSGMNVSHTLFNSYGDLNGIWEASVFHAGIDIDATTGEPDCNEVRCVDDGYATKVDEVPIPGTQDETQWIVIICDELGGAVENGWSYGHLTQPSFSEEEYVAEGELIGYMHDSVSVPHVHFMWNNWDSNHMAEGNPLQYLDKAPLFEEGYEWEFNPENHDPPFEFFFLPQIWYTDWDDLTVSAAFDSMIDPSDLSGNVDFFFGIALRGDGMPGGEGVGRNSLAPQKIKWDVVREFPSGDQILDSKYVVDFDCWLSGDPDSRAQMLYFRHSMFDMYEYNALLCCLSNCIDADDWDGINNIDETHWNTDSDREGSADTDNPILAKYPDGPHRLDVTYYSFDEDYTYPESIDIELHNFSL